MKKLTYNLSSDYKEIKEAYDKLSKTIKLFEQVSCEDGATLCTLKATVMDKQMAINIHLNTIAKLKSELETVRIETKRVNKLLISYSTSSYVIDHILPKQPEKIKKGATYLEI